MPTQTLAHSCSWQQHHSGQTVETAQPPGLTTGKRHLGCPRQGIVSGAGRDEVLTTPATTRADLDPGARGRRPDRGATHGLRDATARGDVSGAGKPIDTGGGLAVAGAGGGVLG